MQIGLFTAASGVTIPSTETIVSTTGYHTLGKGRAHYKKVASAPPAWTAIPRWWFQSADGAYWVLNEEKPDLLQFGGFDDANRAYLSNTVTGTDNTAILNELIYYCQVNTIPNAYVPSGKYKFDDVIHVGYGDGTTTGGYSHVNLIGSHPFYTGHAGTNNFNGTAFYSTKSDRPLLNVQGNRKCEIRGILFAGLFLKWCVDNNVCVISGDDQPTLAPKVDDRDITQWNDPTLSANQDTQYTPYAAVTIDAYCGPRPAVSYPNATYPSYTGITTQWGKGQTSEVDFFDCQFEGFIAGVAVQPCDYDGNGDFVRFYRCNWLYTKYGVTVGNGQSRNVGLYDCNPVFVHTLLEGLTHGRRSGRFQGPIVNMSGGEMMQLVNVNGPVGAPISFYDCYVEGLDRIGQVYGSAAGALTFVGGSAIMGLDSYHNVRGTPPNHFNGSNLGYKGAAVAGPINFTDTQLTYRGALVLLSADVTIKGGIMSEYDTDSQTTVASYKALAHNATSGGVITPYFGARPEQGEAKIGGQFRVRNVSTGVAVSYSAVQDSVWGKANRIYGSPVYAQQLSDFPLTVPVFANKSWSLLPKSVRFPGAGALTLTNVSGKMILQGTLQSGPNANAECVLPGDVLCDDQTGLTFHVFSFDTTTRVMKAVLVNGYKGTGGSTALVDTFSPTAGGLFSCSGRRYTPGYPVFVTSEAAITLTGDVASGSAVVTNVTSASELLVGKRVTGTGIPANTVCTGVFGTTVILSAAATASTTATSLVFGVSSATLTNVGDARGVAVASASISAGDFWESDIYTENVVNLGTTITAVSDPNRTMSLSTAALWPALANYRIRSMRIAPPTNLTAP